MSMRHFGCHGYTVKASDLTKLLPLEQQESYNKFLNEDNCDWESAQKILEKHLPKRYPLPILFIMYEDFESDDLETSIIYASWDTSELFVSTPKEALLTLRASGVDPVLSRWVEFG